MTKNTRDEAFYWTARNKEKKMKETLKEMKRIQNKPSTGTTPQQTLLQTFVQEQRENKIIIFVDSREQASAVNKELFAYKDVKIIMKPLDTGDYILSKDVCVERKTVEDFLVSMLDGRLFPQLINLRQKYAKPLIILEGNKEELFTLRNIHRNSLIGALTSIALDYQVPIINAKDSKETAEYLHNIAKREQIAREKAVSIRIGRKGLTLSEQQRFIVEGLPLVGPLLAKSLLEKFGSIKAIVEADEKQLQEIENLGKKKARTIQKVLREKYDENKTTLIEEQTEEMESIEEKQENKTKEEKQENKTREEKQENKTREEKQENKKETNQEEIILDEEPTEE
jgi:Fanconi anemia group M protein